jgi:glycosyltransferase involved in cell wall biosynthesis
MSKNYLKYENLREESDKNIHKPLVSLITVVKNNDKYIQETFESIKNQTKKNFEYIVIDGNSSDGTKEVIKKNEHLIDFYISENDESLWDGFNKGMSLAKGEYIGFVNSDDVLLPNAMKIFESYKKKNNFDFFFGSVKKHWGILHGYKPWKIHYSWGFYSSHSTGFYLKQSVFKDVGYYNLKYKFSADYDYFYRLIVKHKYKGMASKKDEVFGIFRRGGFSSQIKFIDHFFEEIKIRIDNKQNKLLILIIFIYKFLKNFKKF